MVARIALILLASAVVATPVAAETVDVIRESFERRMQINRAGMTVLGSWAVGNIALGTGLTLAGVGDPSFHQMNVLWNTVNLGLAAGTLIHARRATPSESLAQEIRAQHRIEKILLFNAGLDVGYMALGLWMRDMDSGRLADELPGWGDALILQGAFLFVFDLALFAIHRRNRIYERALPEKLSR